jgi:hypothetical protein
MESPFLPIVRNQAYSMAVMRTRKCGYYSASERRISIKQLGVGRGLMEAIRIDKTVDNPQPSFWSILYRTIVSHTVTYFATGVIAAILLDYSTRMIQPEVSLNIRKITDPILKPPQIWVSFPAF